MKQVHIFSELFFVLHSQLLHHRPEVIGKVLLAESVEVVFVDAAENRQLAFDAVLEVDVVSEEGVGQLAEVVLMAVLDKLADLGQGPLVPVHEVAEYILWVVDQEGQSQFLFLLIPHLGEFLD